jgi:homoserine O-acetyltransferase
MAAKTLPGVDTQQSPSTTAPWVYLPFEGAKLIAERAAQIPARSEYEVTTLFHHERFRLDTGRSIGPIDVAFETWGTLSQARDNVVLVCHALTGDSHVAGHGGRDSSLGWWEPMVGPRRPLDTNRYFVVCANVLGGCYGTTGPASTNPSTGASYGPDFPMVTIRDMVRLQRELLLSLGIDRLFAVLGGSMGGMQALEWAATFPDSVDNAVVIAAPGRIRAQAIAFNEVQRKAIESDPDWKGGRYEPSAGPARGLALARMVGMITYQSEESMERKFGSKRLGSKTMVGPGDKVKISQYLHYQGDKLVRRFDANSYLTLLRAIDLFDLSRPGCDYYGALGRVKAQVLVVGVTSDILYPPHQQRELVSDLFERGRSARYVEIQSPLGHDAFLLDFVHMGRAIREFLKERRWFPVTAGAKGE